MSNGHQVCLGDFAEVVMGQAPPGRDCNKDGRGTIFVKAGEFDQRRPLIREWTTNPLKLARLGDVLVCVVGATAGKINEAIDCAIGRSVAAVRPESSKVFSGYLYHFLATQVLGLRAKSQGLAQGVITREMLLGLPIPLPPLSEQRRIAAILDKVEELRAKRRVTLAQLDTLIQSMFLCLFGDPGTNPRKWVKKPLGDLVAEFRYGTSNKSNIHGKPALRIPNVVAGIIDISDLKLVPVNSTEFERLRLIEGDILFVRTNGNPDYVGRCAVFRASTGAASGFAPDEFIFASYLIRARLDLVQLEPIFLREFMLGAEGRKQLRSRSKTSAGQFNINTENLGAIDVPLPPLDLQREFARRVAGIEKLKTLYRASLSKFDALFASLQYRAFRGEL